MITIMKEIIREPLIILNEFKSAGLDKLHLRKLKELAEGILEPLAIIFNKLCKMSKVVKEWKRINIVLLLKEKRVGGVKRKTRVITIWSS